MASSSFNPEHYHVEPVSAMDAHSGGAHLTFTTGVIFSGVVEEARICAATRTLARAWPLLGSRLRRINPEGPAIELLVPDAEHAVLSTTINTIPKPLHQVEHLPTRTSTITTQKLSRNLSLYHHTPQSSPDEYIASQRPGFHLHVSSLTDATIFTLTFPHVLMDASGVSTFMRGLVNVLEGKNVLPCLEGDPWSSIVESARDKKVKCVEHDNGWRVYGSEQFGIAAEAEQADLQEDGQIAQRTVYFPAGEIERLKTLAMDDISEMGMGQKVPYLSSGDVVVAWLYKQFYGDEKYDLDRTSRLLYVLDARLRLPEIFTPSHVHLKNGYLVMIASKYPNSKVHDMPLGEIALMVRGLVNENSDRERLVEQLTWKYENAGKVQVPAPAGERVMFASNWLTFGLGELSIADVIKPHSGTGRVLDVYCGMPGIPRCSGVITHRDSDGGVVAAFDWAESNWTSGTIGEYAVERLQREETLEKSGEVVSDPRIYSLLSWVWSFLRL